RRRAAAAFRRNDRGRITHRTTGLDARAVPEDARAADGPARALGNHRDAAGRQLDHTRSEPETQGDPDGEGPGRGRPRTLPVLGRRNAWNRSADDDRAAHRRYRQIFVDLQL